MTNFDRVRAMGQADKQRPILSPAGASCPEGGQQDPASVTDTVKDQMSEQEMLKQDKQQY